MVIEKVVQEQASKFLNYNNIFYKYQSDFKSNLFLSFLNDNILRGFDNEMYTVLFLTDLKKVFDTMTRKILLGKFFQITFSKNSFSELSVDHSK